MTVSKNGLAGEQSSSVQTSDDKLWLISYSEYLENTAAATYGQEGTTYDYYSQVVKPVLARANSGLALMGTRAGNVPAGTFSQANDRRYYTRTPAAGGTTVFLVGFANGMVESGYHAATACGVVPAFCF